MTERERAEYESLRLEISAREEVVKKLSAPQKLLSEQAKARLEKRKAKVASACEYRNIEEARDAWGYDCISEKEFEEIKSIFERGEDYILNRLSIKEVAAKILDGIVGRLLMDISVFKKELRELEKNESGRESVARPENAQ